MVHLSLICSALDRFDLVSYLVLHDRPSILRAHMLPFIHRAEYGPDRPLRLKHSEM